MGTRLFLDTCLYDIGQTVIRALHQLSQYPAAYARVSGAPRTLQQVALAVPEVRLIAEATMPPLDTPSPKDWPETYILQALEAGCAGAIINQADLPVLSEIPHADIFLRN